MEAQATQENGVAAPEERSQTKLSLSSRENGTFSMAPRNFEEAWRMAQLIAASDMVPKDYKGNAGNVLIAMEMGSEVGLKPLQALQNIAVINGRPALWGDAVLAVCQGSAAWDASAFSEEFEGVYPKDDFAAVCTVRRKGGKIITRTFSIADAKEAGLWSKQGPWKQYPKRMLQMRARAFAVRDGFSDVLRGLHVAEEIQDVEDAEYVEVEESGVTVVRPSASTRTESVREKLSRRAQKADQEPSPSGLTPEEREEYGKQGLFDGGADE